MTTGTKTPDTRSATCAMGAFVATAFSTISMIWFKVVSPPTRVATQVSAPFWFKVAALTLSPAPLSTGRLSPVSAASSTALSPAMTSPSTGMLSPGFTIKVSPFTTSSASIVTSTPSRSTCALFGARSIRLLTAFVVFPLLYASSIFPTVIKVRIIAADSKYMSCRQCIAISASPTPYAPPMRNITAALYTKAAALPSATSVSIFGARCISPVKPFTKNF